jgi:hypothetical protein
VRQLIKSYWFWFYTTIGTISIVDYIDHLNRTESYFRDINFDWFMFTFASTLTVCLSIYLFNTLTKKLLKTDNLILQSITIVFGVLTHIYLSGPIYDRLIFGERTLNFFPTPTIFIVGLSIFYLIRLVTHLLTRNLKPIGQDVSVKPWPCIDLESLIDKDFFQWQLLINL